MRISSLPCPGTTRKQYALNKSAFTKHEIVINSLLFNRIGYFLLYWATSRTRAVLDFLAYMD